MSSLRKIDRVRGAIQDVAHLQELSGDVCHVLFVSERTLSILNNLSENEVTYPSRYASEFGPQGYYTPVTADDPLIAFVSDVVRALKVEIIPMTCDLTTVLADLATAIEALSTGAPGCASCPEGVVGSVSDPGTTGGQPAVPPPEGFTDDPFTLSDKCAMSNWYYQQTISVLESLDEYNALGWIGLGVALAIGQIVTILQAVVSGAFLAIMTGQFGLFASLIEQLGDLPDASLRNIIDAMEADQPGFVCALYTSTDVGNTRENIQDWAQPAGLSPAEDLLLRTILNNYVLNGLFYWSDSQLTEALTGTGYYDCALCGIVGDGIEWSVDFGTGTPTYDGSEWVLSSQDLGGGVHYAQITITCPGDPYPEGGNWTVQFTATTIDTSLTGYTRKLNAFTSACALVVDNYQESSPSFPPLLTDLTFASLEMANDEPFTITIASQCWSRYLSVGESPDTNTVTC